MKADPNTQIPLVSFVLDTKEFSFFKRLCDKMILNMQSGIPMTKANEYLAGQIQNEYQIEARHYPKILNIFKPAIQSHMQHFPSPIYYNINFENLVMQTCWVNFQKKHEYNPAHAHSGIFSFVLWVKIPYLIEQENNVENCNQSNEKVNGNFYFILPAGPMSPNDISSVSIPVDKEYEGKGILFPSNFWHGVHPFYTSDEYRISISGNFVFKK